MNVRAFAVLVCTNIVSVGSMSISQYVFVCMFECVENGMTEWYFIGEFVVPGHSRQLHAAQ